ncbi:hypothetical protein D6C90_03489 [Aureobasidium pullulans]|uniref:Uncharacterized protein n=1 Tax=Aureobasidium pullulans TaxID=5580 RepID=A0A4S9VDP5_AURPU|nr:hypothetical protein D6C90_03489 [Aureobasidium pullulans]
MTAGFNVIAAIREKAFGHVVENETKAAFSVSAVSHVDDGFNVIDAVVWFVVASFHAVVIIVDVAVDVAVDFGVEVVVIGSRNAYVMSGDYLDQGYWPATLLSVGRHCSSLQTACCCWGKNRKRNKRRDLNTTRHGAPGLSSTTNTCVEPGVFTELAYMDP